MIKYHILALLSLCVAGVTGIEAAVNFMQASPDWMSSGKGWLMTLLCAGSIFLYFRSRKFRKEKAGF